jgi:PD-(D/E)XK nuclease superfamily
MSSVPSDSTVKVTWVAKLMTGEGHCEWSPWFQAHYRGFIAVNEQRDWSNWRADHTDMLRLNSDILRRYGWKVFVERINAMQLLGGSGITLCGTPDIVAIKGGQVRIEDCKTGTPYPSHRLQVLIYMLMLPAARPRYRGMPLEGHLFYKGSTEDVCLKDSDLDDGFRETFRYTVHRVGGENPPMVAPSPAECRWCPIGPSDCPDRIPGFADPSSVEHDLF